MCGVVGITFNRCPQDLAQSLYTGLYHLHHRGFDSAGMVVGRPDGSYKQHRKPGTIDRAFLGVSLGSQEWSGYVGTGQVRYSTSGVDFGDSRSVEEAERAAQPLEGNFRGDPFFLSYNGNLTPRCIGELQAGLYGDETDKVVQERPSWVDTELIVHAIEHSSQQVFEDVLYYDVLPRLRGAFSIVLLYKNKLYALRDPWGFRPLEIGQNKNGYIISSEDCVFDKFPDGKKIGSVEPGECIIFDSHEGSEDRIKHFCWAKPSPTRCTFEYVYFSRPDSTFEGRRVALLRRALGRALAREYPPPNGAGLVIGVPDSGVTAAHGYALESGMCFDPTALFRLHGAGRTFIEPVNDLRKRGIEYKLAVIPELVEGQIVVVVDDSIVRGNVTPRVVMLLKSNGAREVHMRVSSPPTRYGCWYGIDTFRIEQELVARGLDEAMILEKINEETQRRYGNFLLDSLGYLSLEGMKGVWGGGGLCDACWTGNYLVQ